MYTVAIFDTQTQSLSQVIINEDTRIESIKEALLQLERREGEELSDEYIDWVHNELSNEEEELKLQLQVQNLIYSCIEH